MCVVLPIVCIHRIRSETAFDEYLQRDLRLIKAGNLARYVILSLVIWGLHSLIGGARGATLFIEPALKNEWSLRVI